jgi:hypothetical protein
MMQRIRVACACSRHDKPFDAVMAWKGPRYEVERLEREPLKQVVSLGDRLRRAGGAVQTEAPSVTDLQISKKGLKCAWCASGKFHRCFQCQRMVCDAASDEKLFVCCRSCGAEGYWMTGDAPAKPRQIKAADAGPAQRHSALPPPSPLKLLGGW